MLVQSESEKLKEREVKHNTELKEWKDSLPPRKRVCVVFLKIIFFYQTSPNNFVFNVSGCYLKK